mmetsp:Transcript_38161/g.77873  ORF Transcript_38161/g.77873 Transcript_38161/m.77873 type:complete len:201 (-) Transcript_38161:1964-2566(-)
MKRDVKVVTIRDQDRPNRAWHTRPPSVFPRGRRLSEFIISPANPATASGCSAMVSRAGFGVSNIPSPRRPCTIPPTRLDERTKLMGRLGNCAKAAASEYRVDSSPTTRRANDATRPARGPATAKSKRELMFLGGDLIGVMAPVRPSCRDGTKVGRPTSILSFSAIILWPISCANCTAINPPNSGKAIVSSQEKSTTPAST